MRAHVPRGVHGEGVRVELRIARTARGLRGVLVTTDRDGERGERSVDGRTCAEVAHALAFLAGLAIELSAAPASRADDRGAGQPAPEHDKLVALPPSPAGVKASVPVAHPPRSARSEPGVGAPGASLWQRGVVASEEVRGGLGPVARAGASVGLELAQRSARAFAPAVRFELTGAQGHVSSSTVSARLYLATTRIAACPLHYDDLGTISLHACAEAEVGVLWTTGSTAAIPRSPVLPWASLGAIARIQWLVSRRVFVDLAVGAEVSLVRASLFVEPSAVIYTVPWVTERVSLGPGLRF